MTKKLHRLEISRKNWVNGRSEYDDYGAAALLNYKGKQCCLGFHAESCGISRVEMLNTPSPTELGSKLCDSGTKDLSSTGTFQKLLSPRGLNSSICKSMILINDSEKLTDSKREEILTKKFRSIGVLVKFVD